MKNTTGKKVFVAMSGGVDSSVSAALLKQADFDVVGVYMKQWSPKVLGSACIWKQDRQDAMAVCAKLGIPFLTWDYSKEYEKQVGKYMIDSYKKGITPNPDVMCNKVIKFGLFYDKAMKMGADFVATGHYAISKNKKLLKAKDDNKDQTYFLYTLKKEQLAKIIFPVGFYTKPEVRILAKEFKLENAEKKDSQGVCFIGPLNMKHFLKSYIKPKKGNIVLISRSKPGMDQKVKIWIKVDEKTEKIKKLKWRTFGCASAIASTSMFSVMVTEKGGMKLNDALKVRPQDIMQRLHGLPARKVHCSVLCDKAFRQAVNNYFRNTKQYGRIVVDGAKVIDKNLNITDKDIESAVLDGAKNLLDVQKRLKVGVGDPKAIPEIEQLIKFYNEKYYG